MFGVQNGDCPVAMIGKRVLEGVDDQLGDDEADADRYVCRDRAVVHLDRELKLVVVRDHRRADALAELRQIRPEFDVGDVGGGELLLHRRN